MRYHILFFIAILITILSCNKDNTTEPSSESPKTIPEPIYHAEITFNNDHVSSVFYSYSGGFLSGITTNWAYSSQNYSLDFENNKTKYSTDSTSTLLLSKVDSSHVMLTMEPHHLTVVCDLKGNRSYGSYWYSNSLSYNSFYSYYKVGTIRQRISAQVTIKQ